MGNQPKSLNTVGIRRKNGSVAIAVSVFALSALVFFSYFLIIEKRTQSIQEYSKNQFSSSIQKINQIAVYDEAYFESERDEEFVPRVHTLLKDHAEIAALWIIDQNGGVEYQKGKAFLPDNFFREFIETELQEVVIAQNSVYHSRKVNGRTIVVQLNTDQIVLRSQVEFGILFTLFALFIGFIFVAIRKRWIYQAGSSWGGWGGLRTKFLLMILVINLFTAAVIFYSLSWLTRNDEVARLKKEIQVFSQFATQKILNDYSQFYYFQYDEKFIPAVNELVKSNKNLTYFRMAKIDDASVFFDSRDERQIGASETIELSENQLQLLSSGESWIDDNVSTSGSLRVIIPAGGSGKFRARPNVVVEFFYGLDSLKRSVAVIRDQILLDLIPSITFGILVALFFSQLFISPIKMLLSALQKVTIGEYGVAIPTKRKDELGQLVQAFNQMSEELRKKTELKKYLSESTYKRVVEGDTTRGMNERGNLRKATILFADIRDFVKFCDVHSPEEVTDFLNSYFDEMVKIIKKYGGDVDKFIGDAILAAFYESDESNYVDDKHAQSGESNLNAIYCALEMRQKLLEINSERKSKGQSEIENGIGMDYGNVISGPIGSENRRDFTVIGDVVNVASRIEKLTKEAKKSKILVSENVMARVEGLVSAQEMLGHDVRGKSSGVKVFEIYEIVDFKKIRSEFNTSTAERKSTSLDAFIMMDPVEGMGFVCSHWDELSEDIKFHVMSTLRSRISDEPGKIVEFLFQCLKNESNERVISSVVSSIACFADSDRVLELQAYLTSSNERLVSNVIEAIGVVRSEQSRELLLPFLESESGRIKANAAVALFRSGAVEVIHLLKPMLIHTDPRNRSSAAFAIGELARTSVLPDWGGEGEIKGDEVKYLLAELQECVPILIRLLDDRETSVKKQSLWALGQIKDRSAILPIIRNIDTSSEELIEDYIETVRNIGSHRSIQEYLERVRDNGA